MGLAAALVVLVTATTAPPRIGMAPVSASGVEESERAFYETHLQRALLRYGIPLDSVEETSTRAGAEALRECTEPHPAGCIAARGAYAAIVVSRVTHRDGAYQGQFAVVDTSSGGIVAAETVSAPDVRAFLDGCTSAAKKLADQIASRFSMSLPADAPHRGAAVYPLVAGGVLIGTGVYFLVAASSDSSALKSPSTSLSDAVTAKSNGPRNLALGITLTSLGVVSTVVGIVLYAPGAERKPLVQLHVDPFQQRLAISGVFP